MNAPPPSPPPLPKVISQSNISAPCRFGGLQPPAELPSGDHRLTSGIPWSPPGKPKVQLPNATGPPLVSPGLTQGYPRYTYELFFTLLISSARVVGAARVPTFCRFALGNHRLTLGIPCSTPGKPTAHHSSTSGFPGVTPGLPQGYQHKPWDASSLSFPGGPALFCSQRSAMSGESCQTTQLAENR